MVMTLFWKDCSRLVLMPLLGSSFLDVIDNDMLFFLFIVHRDLKVLMAFVMDCRGKLLGKSRKRHHMACLLVVGC